MIKKVMEREFVTWGDVKKALKDRYDDLRVTMDRDKQGNTIINFHDCKIRPLTL